MNVDLVIVGAGIAGLWLANVLGGRGYQVIVLEAQTLGGQQTLASQGMIHGGLKYALGGNLTRASEAISGMPARWRACLTGSGEIDLSALEPLSDRYYLFAEASTLGRLTGFFASKSLRGRIEKLNPDDYPPVFRDPAFDGVVYALDDLVLDTPALIQALYEKLDGSVYRHALQPDQIQVHDDGVEIHTGSGTIAARQLILCAGAGTQALLDGLDIPAPQMQLRPLRQVVVRHNHPQPLYAHCLTGIRRPEPRLTITSHAASHAGSPAGREPDGDHWLWYLGGQLASDGAAMTEAALIAHAHRELLSCVPWVAWNDAEFSTVSIDRAEPKQAPGLRPDEAFAQAAAGASGNVLVCWPTKLSLVPDLADKVAPLLAAPTDRAASTAADPTLPTPAMGRAPWED